MTTLLEFREWLKQTYAKFSLYIKAGIRFLVSLAVFMMITYRMGYMAVLKTPVVPILLALVCTFLPVNLMVVLAMLLLLGHLYALSMEIAAVMLVLFIILYLLYYRFSPKFGFVLVLTPIAFVCKVPYVIPIILGLVSAPVTILPVSFGTVIYYLLHNISQYGANAASAGTKGTVKTYVYVFMDALKDPAMYLYIITFAVALVLVYFIRRLSADQSWIIAIVTGAIAELVFILIGNFALDISVGMVSLLVGTVLAVLVALVVQFFVFNVDYSRTEYVQFEDDEYYYYVKAVPKVSIAKREKTVKRINPQKNVRIDRMRFEDIE